MALFAQVLCQAEPAAQEEENLIEALLDEEEVDLPEENEEDLDPHFDNHSGQSEDDFVRWSSKCEYVYIRNLGSQ